ncbi:methyltransferase family protein [Chromohalobacter marismortui]|uniref:tRNA 5-carboxymethoxyuridine methyltransferase n=1 Tax=Chromohalobacter marismortui TaxID=42055 RepID=A0A4R7NIL7_9GAMM|nr:MULTISPECIES: methyltransferase domain-containing protein [Chromohalobacter]MCI0511532.1 methyltransferase domain-containing protein [Chromohalobacter sp.]MCI0594457.1 methyltransferase domain-containing protein [Chromohalobacter sp.]TDU20473.1 methyltransferase family protein [Chromohalobacter marismortui]
MSLVTHDRIFDGLADKFERGLYGTPRGTIRLAVLEHVLSHELPTDGRPALDVGAGLGQMSMWLAQRGHAVTMVEPSRDMRERAIANISGLAVTPVDAPWQALPERAPGPWGLIVCHAVLEWLAAPEAAFTQLATLLAPGGYLSLMVFNRDALRFSNVIKGNLDKALDDRLEGLGKRQRLTPISPLTDAQVRAWSAEAGLSLVSVTGVRIFHDYLADRDVSLDKLLELECRHCRQDPHWRLGRYLHYTLFKPETAS